MQRRVRDVVTDSVGIIWKILRLRLRHSYEQGRCLSVRVRRLHGTRICSPSSLGRIRLTDKFENDVVHLIRR